MRNQNFDEIIEHYLNVSEFLIYMTMINSGLFFLRVSGKNSDGEMDT